MHLILSIDQILKNAIIFSSLQSELKSASYYQEMSFNMDIELTDILGSLKMTKNKSFRWYSITLNILSFSIVTKAQTY